MANIKMKAGKRVNITALPKSEQIAEALAGLRDSAVNLEVAIQTVLAGAWYEFHTAEGDARFTIMDETRELGLPSGLAASVERALSAIARNKPESGVAKAGEAVKFAIEQAANIFAHETKARKERRDKARAKAEEKKAEAEQTKRELAEAKAALKAEQEQDDTPEVEQVTMPEYAIVGQNGEVLLQLDPNEIGRVVDMVRRELTAKHKVASVA